MFMSAFLYIYSMNIGKFRLYAFKLIVVMFDFEWHTSIAATIQILECNHIHTHLSFISVEMSDDGHFVIKKHENYGLVSC